MNKFIFLLKHYLRLQFYLLNDIVLVFVLYIFSILLYPLSLDPSPELLRKIFPAIIWIAIIFSITLPLNRLFSSDYHNGTLRLMVMGGDSLIQFVWAKNISLWLFYGIPMSFISPLLGYMLYMSSDLFFIVFFDILLGTLALIFLGSIISSLILGVRNNSILLSFLLFPLYIPILIFATSVIDEYNRGGDYLSSFKLLLALALFFLSLGPYVTAWFLKLSTWE